MGCYASILKMGLVSWLLTAISLAPASAQTRAVCPISGTASSGHHPCCCEKQIGGCPCATSCGMEKKKQPSPTSPISADEGTKIVWTVVAADLERVSDNTLTDFPQASSY